MNNDVIIENIENTIKDIENITNLKIKYILHDDNYISLLVFKDLKNFELINRYDKLLSMLKFLQGFKRSIMMIQKNDLILKES